MSNQNKELSEEDRTILEDILSFDESRRNIVIEIKYIALRNQAFAIIRKGLFEPLDQQESLHHDIFEWSILKFIEKVRAGDFKGNSSIDTFILGICKNRCRDENKKLKNRNQRVTLLDHRTPEQETQDNPLTLLLENTKIDMVRRIISQLGHNCKEYLTAKLDNKKTKEIAISLGVPYNTVNNNYRKTCFKKFRELVMGDSEAMEIVRDLHLING